MNFFKSMLSDDPEPENMDDHEKSKTARRPNQSPTHQGTEIADYEQSNLNSTSSGVVSSGGGGAGGLWSFGDLVKTLTTRSESVLETYRRDLKEFGSGLRKESDLFREVASRAVKELPSSIEVGASAIDGVLKSTADIISQGKDAILEPSGVDDSDASENHSDRGSLNSRVYSRFDSQLNAIQSDARTYNEDPEDLDDYNNWKLGFVLSERESEIEKLIEDIESVEAIYRKVVPNEVDDGSFWCRYFYRVHKLKQQEDMRANLVRRSLTVDDEEDLSWDIDDEEEGDFPETEKKQSSKDESVSSNVPDDDLVKNNTEETRPSGGDALDARVESVQKYDEDLDQNAGKDGVDGSKPESSNDTDEKAKLVPKTDQLLNAGKNNDDVAEEDLEWDEIGDIGDNEEKEVLQSNTPKKADVFKQLNTAEDDEDLNWDIEDDDEPMKASSSK